MIKLCFALLLLLPTLAQAKFMLQYGLHYSSDTEKTEDDDVKTSKTFHKLFLGGSVNQRKTLFFGWNINSWSNDKGVDDGNYSMTEMGPRLTYYFSENYNFFATAEWNPYAKGDREPEEVSGSSLGVGIGYRFKLSRSLGFGAGIYYHSLSLKEAKEGNTEENISDSKTSLMPMLELTFMTR